MMRKIGIVAAVFAVVGCNAILDNKPGNLLETNESGIEPGADAGAGDAMPPPREAGPEGCAAGEHECGGACVWNDDPKYGCGAASCAPCAVAHGKAACAAGACSVGSCDVGFDNCNGDAADGCEADLSRATSCGACNGVCPANLPVCTSTGAGHQCAATCAAMTPLLCGADCVDPQTNAAHCGACNTACPAVPNAASACVAGACDATCLPTFHECPGAPVRCAAADDAAACGPLCAVCPPRPNATPTCVADACAFACVAGTGDCNLLALDGCETNLQNNVAHCGACGIACPLGDTCEAGVCTAPAPPPP